MFVCVSSLENKKLSYIHTVEINSFTVVLTIILEQFLKKYIIDAIYLYIIDAIYLNIIFCEMLKYFT